MRWTEEVELLQEEMRRVLQFLLWQAEWWEQQASRIAGSSREHTEGVVAYAMRQASIRRLMRAHCIKLWGGTHELLTSLKPFNSNHNIGTGRVPSSTTTSSPSTDVFG